MQRPVTPSNVITVITLIAIVTVAYVIYFLFAPQLIQGEVFGAYRYNAIFGLYTMFLFLLGFYTGRYWVVNLFVVISVIGLVLMIAGSFFTGFTIGLWVGVGAIAVKLLIALMLYGQSNRDWFKACKDIRMKRANAGINGDARTLLLFVTGVVFFIWIGFFGYTLKDIMVIPAAMKSNPMLQDQSKAAAAICHRFLTSKKLAPRMQAKGINMSRCQKLMPGQIKRCYKHLESLMPKSMSRKDTVYWMRQVGRCSGKAFYYRYLK